MKNFFVLIAFLISPVALIEVSASNLIANHCYEEAENHSCKRICKEIYRPSKSNIKDCEMLTIAEVYSLDHLQDELEYIISSTESELHYKSLFDNPLYNKELELAFENYVYISPDPLADLISDYSDKESSAFLNWLRRHPKAEEAFEREDDEAQLLRDLVYDWW